MASQSLRRLVPGNTKSGVFADRAWSVLVFSAACVLSVDVTRCDHSRSTSGHNFVMSHLVYILHTTRITGLRRDIVPVHISPKSLLGESLKFCADGDVKWLTSQSTPIWVVLYPGFCYHQEGSPRNHLCLWWAYTPTSICCTLGKNCDRDAWKSSKSITREV